MSIGSEISRIEGNIASAYQKISEKGGTLPDIRNSANLASAIESITDPYLAKGTFTVTRDVTTTTLTKITDITELGFTPKAFILFRSNYTTTRYAMMKADFVTGQASQTTFQYNRTLLYKTTSSALDVVNLETSWTTRAVGHLYFDGTDIHYASGSNRYLVAGTYYWMAMTW